MRIRILVLDLKISDVSDCEISMSLNPFIHRGLVCLSVCAAARLSSVCGHLRCGPSHAVFVSVHQEEQLESGRLGPRGVFLDIYIYI